MATTRNNTTKKAPAAKTASKTAAKPAPEKKTAAAPVPDEKDSEIEALKRQLADMKALLETANRPQIVQIGGDTEKVNFLWQAEVADDNVVVFGDGGMYGRIVGKTGTFSVPKSDLSRLLDGMNRFFLDKRWLIVLDGLTEDEREMLGVAYSEGEVLDRRAFAKMVELGAEILEIYPRLCDSHKEMVAKRYHEAYMNGDPHVTREIVVELSRLAKSAGRGEDFKDIIENMNAKDIE